MNRPHLYSAFLLGTCSLLQGCGDADTNDESASTTTQAVGAAITWRSSSIGALDQTTGGATSIVVAKPAGTLAQDVEVAVVATSSWVSLTAPAGWTLVKSQTDTGTVVANAGVKTSIYTHVAGSGEPGSYTFGLSGKARAVVSIQSYINVDTGHPIDAEASASEAASATSHKSPSIVTTQSGTVLLGIFGFVNPHEPASATSTMAHERADRSTGNAGSWGINLAIYDSDPRLAAAAEGGRSAISSSATDTATMTLLALRPKAPQPASTLYGAAFNPHNEAHYTQLIGAFGGMDVTRSFDNSAGVGPFLNSYQALDIAHGAASAYSFKYDPSAVNAGTHDAALTSFFQGIVDNHVVYWTYWHEPDDELYVDHTFTPTAYRQAWAHIKQIADGVKASRPKLKIYATSIIMEYSMTPKIAPKRPLEGPNGMYPGDDVIDVFGVDAYNPGADKGQIKDAASEFGVVIDFAQAHGKPWAIGEIGSCDVVGNPQGRATFLKNAIAYWNSRSYPPVYVSYFDVDWSTCDYRLENDPPALKVWHDAVVGP